MKNGLSGKALEAVLDKIERRAKEETEKGNLPRALGLDEARRVIWNAWITTTDPKLANKKRKPKRGVLGRIIERLPPESLDGFTERVAKNI